jgi:predicted amidohydrolase
MSRSGHTTRAVPITASICLDLAFPDVLSALPSRPALILAPAKTWHRDVSLAMWEQARARAEEMGSMVLFCDGGAEGVSGVAGHGMREVFHVGPGTWMRAVGIEYPFDEGKTVYAAGGDWAMFLLVWGILGVGWTGEIGLVWLGRFTLQGSQGRARQILAALWGKIRRTREEQGQGEQQPLLA